MTGIYRLTLALVCFVGVASGCVKAEFNNPFLGPFEDLMGIVTNPRYLISGVIKNPDGSVISSVSISFTQNHQLSASGAGSTIGNTTTDSSGCFAFRLRAGSYRVGIIKSNQLAESMNLTVVAGAPGDTVIISGLNFSTNVTENQVLFNGVAVSNGVFGNVPSFATDPFISEIYPIQGSVGSRMIIKGKNFSTTASLNFISFGGAFATSLSSTSTTLDLAVPAGASSGTLMVTVGTTRTPNRQILLRSCPEPQPTPRKEIAWWIPTIWISVRHNDMMELKHDKQKSSSGNEIIRHHIMHQDMNKRGNRKP